MLSVFPHLSIFLIKPYKTSVALLFSAIFHLIAIMLIGLSVQQFIGGLEKPDWDLVTLIIKSITTRPLHEAGAKEK